MNDSNLPRRPVPPLRLAASAPGAPPGLPPPLGVLLEAIAGAVLDRVGLAPAIVQRLGDARTLALLREGDTACNAGRLVAEALRHCVQSLAERPEDASGRLALVRANGSLRIGQVLLAQGLIAQRRLEAALASQPESGRRIGEELVARGQIAAREVAEALWLQHKLRASVLALVDLAARDAPGRRPVRVHK
jgi:hypothetical protein